MIRTNIEPTESKKVSTILTRDTFRPRLIGSSEIIYVTMAVLQSTTLHTKYQTLKYIN